MNGLAKVLIVGGGFSGTMVAHHLAKNSRETLDVTLLEASSSLARGVAYGTNDLMHLLNVPAHSMSALPDKPAHFLEWLKSNGQLDPARDFYSRKLYGEYLETLFTEIQSSLKIIRDEAVSAAPAAGGKIRVRTRSHGEIVCDRMVLATGPIGLTSDPFASVRQSPYFISSFWTSMEWSQIPTDAVIGILGTGLSMIDAIASLKERRHEGTIHAVSRHGLLPQVHASKSQNYKLTLPIDLRPRPLLRFLRGQTFSWRDAIDGLRPFTNSIWQSWDAPEKRRFLRHLKPYWETHRHRMAPEIASLVQSFKESAQLKLHRARIESIERLAQGFILFLKDARGVAHELRMEYLIDCTGSGKNPPGSSMLALNELGLGIESTSPHIYTVGPVRKGALWETTAIPELRVQAQQVALQLLADI